MNGRRTALRTLAAAGAATMFSGTVPGLAALAATPLRVRRCVNDMADDDPDLQTYRDFVGIMIARPQTTPVSWLGFASQHGDELDYKFCPHGDWYFLPWHRGFVDMYERAAAALTGNPGFAMPYWDWTTQRTLPAAFTAKTYKGQPNPLLVPGIRDPECFVRNPLTGKDALTDAIVGPDVMQQIYAETDFELFGTSRPVDRSDKDHPRVQDNLDPRWVPMGGGHQGKLESTPHNLVHNDIGAYMPNSDSPRDPIFMMHHSNIDRIWAHWNALGRKNSTDPLWLDMPFTDNYISPTGQTYTRKVSELLSTEALGYTYDRLPAADGRQHDAQRAVNVAALLSPASAAGSGRTRFRQLNTVAARPLAHLSVPVQVGAATLAPAVTAPAGRAVVALISDIRIGAKVRAIRVFVDHPAPSQDTPDSDPHYVTTLSFLRHRGAHASHRSLPSAAVDLTATLRRLAGQTGGAGDVVTVQLLPVPVRGASPSEVGDVVPASIEIAVI